MKIHKHKISAIIPYLMMSTLYVSCLTYSTSGGLFIDISKLNLSLIAVGGTCIFVSFFFLTKSQFEVKHIAFNRIDFAIVIWFIFIILISLVTKRHFRQDQFLLFSIGILSYICCRTILLNERKKMLSAFLLGIGLLTAIESITAILQFVNLMPSLNKFFIITGTFKNPAPLALFLSSCLPFIYYSFCIVRKTSLKIFFASNLVLSLFVICISGNRASYLAIIVIIGVYLVIQFNLFSLTFDLLQTRATKFIASTITLGAICLITFCLYGLKPVSADARLLIWTISYPQIFERPFLGGGIGSFKENYSTWQAMYFDSNVDSQLLSDTAVSNIAGYIRLAYNEYLEILLEQGLVGLFLFLSIFYYAFRSGLRALTNRRKSILLPAIAAFLAILTQSFISYPLHSLPSVILIFILLAFLNHDTNLIKPNLIRGQRKAKIIIFLLLMGGALTLSIGLKRYKSYSRYLSARKIFNLNQGYSKTIFDSLSMKLSTDPNFLIDYSICLAANNEYEAALINLNKASKLDGDPQIHILLGDYYIKLTKYELAEKSYKMASLIVPSLIYPRYALVKVLILKGKIGDAKMIARSILESQPKLPSEKADMMIQEMRFFLSSK